MSAVVSSRRMTFTYFSIVAFAIIAVHVAMFDAILDDIESLYAENRLMFEYEQNRARIDRLAAGKLAVTPAISVYAGREHLPEYVRLPEQLVSGETYASEDDSWALPDLSGENHELQYFLLYQKNAATGGEVFLVSLDMVYEQSEDQVFLNQFKQLGLSLLLLMVSLLVVMRISTHLTRPLSQLAEQVKRRHGQDFSPVVLRDVAATTEVVQLVSSFNEYQGQIQAMLDRERSFNRYASHELRSPLMVIKGACSLLKQAPENGFVDKQRQRIEESCSEINDIVSTLLSLTRDEKDVSQSPARDIDREELAGICRDHEALLQGRDVSWSVHAAPGVQLPVPETTFKILLGNLVKNAFAHTDHGSVMVELNSVGLKVRDTGHGLSAEPRGIEGYGLGLVIVRDICRKYQWTFRLMERDSGGCVAEVVFRPGQTPSAGTTGS